MDPYKDYHFIANDENKNKNNLRMTYSKKYYSKSNPNFFNLNEIKSETQIKQKIEEINGKRIKTQ